MNTPDARRYLDIWNRMLEIDEAMHFEWDTFGSIDEALYFEYVALQARLRGRA
jgi:hypothetical protein